MNNGATSSGTTSAPNNNISSQTPAPEGTSDATSLAQHTVEGQSIEGTFAREAVRQIEPIIELFRTDKIKKSQVIYRIGQVLAAEPTGNEQMHSSSTQELSTELSCSLLQRINMGHKSPSQDLCTKDELEDLVSEVESMQSLTGILPMT